jgi:hypothetical protein
MNNVDLCRTLTDECFLLYTLHFINTGSKFNDIGYIDAAWFQLYLVSQSVLYIFFNLEAKHYICLSSYLQFRHWWKSSRLLVRLGGLYVFSFDSTVAPKVLLLDPERYKSIKKLVKFAKMLGQGGDEMRVFLKTVKPFTRSMRITVGAWRWVEAAPCRRGEVGLEEFMVSSCYEFGCM